jgi:hypothetical protein
MAQWPTSPAPNQIKISSVYPTLVSTAQSLKQQVRSRGAQRWKLELAYVNLTRQQVAPIRAAALALRGQFNTCTFAMPSGVFDAAQGTWPGTPQVNGGSQVGRSVLAKGFTASQSGVAKADDFLQFAGDLKVYSMVADANSDSGGLATLSIEPALMLSPANSSNLVFGPSVLFTLASESDLCEFPMRPGANLAGAAAVSDYAISLIERC